MKSTKILIYCTISSVMAIIIFFSVWIGIFFGETYPEIRVKETFLKTQCMVIDRIVISSKCCETSCTYCSECLGSLKACSSVRETLAINGTSQCCNGYKCCSQCCDTCESCDADGKCTSYECNCYCCSSVSSLLCDMTCRECWTPTITMRYNTVENVSVISTMEKKCNSDFNCVDTYFEKYQINTTSTCFYNPFDTKEFATSNTYTDYKFGPMYTFAILTILSLIWCCLPLVGVATYFLCKKVKISKLLNLLDCSESSGKSTSFGGSVKAQSNDTKIHQPTSLDHKPKLVDNEPQIDVMVTQPTMPYEPYNPNTNYEPGQSQTSYLENTQNDQPYISYAPTLN